GQVDRLVTAGRLDHEVLGGDVPDVVRHDRACLSGAGLAGVDGADENDGLGPDHEGLEVAVHGAVHTALGDLERVDLDRGGAELVELDRVAGADDGGGGVRLEARECAVGCGDDLHAPVGGA